MKKKVSKTDFIIDSLPKTRKEQFFDIVKNRFNNLFSIGLFLLLFTIPFFIVLLTKHYYIALASAEFADDVEKYREFSLTNSLIFDAFFAIAFIVISLGLSGIYRIFRKLCWGEGIFFLNDFGIGIKQNGLRFSIYSLIFSLLRFISDLAILTIDNGFFKYVPFAIEMLFIPLLLMVLSFTAVYTNKFVKTFVLSTYMCLRRPLSGLLFCLLPIAITFIKIINAPIIQIVIYIILFLLLLPLYLLASYLYCLDVFDAASNKEYFKEIYKKGLCGEFKKENNSNE